jgi:exopolysaccharide biosynthesis polyprenyl glycosylphosphotransferase
MTALFIFILRLDIFSRLVFVESAVCLAIILSSWRTVKRCYVRYLIYKGHSNYNVLIVGAGSIGLALAEEINALPFLGINNIGFVDDVKTGKVNGGRVLGTVKDLEKIAAKHFIDEIYLTIPSQRDIAAHVIQVGTKLNRTIRIVAEHFDMPYCRVELNYIGAIPMMTYVEKCLSASENATKRLVDIAISSFVLIILAPVFLLLILLIKLESPGPAFYVSKRSGKKGVVFSLYKFRSMIRDADHRKSGLKIRSEVEGPIFKIRNDPRLTRIGKFLRKFSIDELPQLLNVLKGDMSLVGPRPFPTEESNAIEYKHIPRLNIRPGMTGLAQVKGRSDLKFNNWMRWDIWYVEHWSLGLDMKILLWTIPTVMHGKGAY